LEYWDARLAVEQRPNVASDQRHLFKPIEGILPPRRGSNVILNEPHLHTCRASGAGPVGSWPLLLKQIGAEDGRRMRAK
jgi:hypothetical protein